MARKKNTAKTVQETNKQNAPTPALLYCREAILRLDKHQDRVDLLVALLRPEKRYALAEVDEMIGGFLKGKVKT